MKTSEKSNAISYESVQSDLGMTGAIVRPIMGWKSPNKFEIEWSIKMSFYWPIVGDCSNCPTGNCLTENDSLICFIICHLSTPYLAFEPNVISFYDTLEVRLPFLIILSKNLIEDQTEMIKFKSKSNCGFSFCFQTLCSPTFKTRCLAHTWIRWMELRMELPVTDVWKEPEERNLRWVKSQLSRLYFPSTMNHWLMFT